MNKKQLIDYFDSTTPRDSQKSRMKKAILSHSNENEVTPKQNQKWGWAKLLASVACVALAILFIVYNPFAGDSDAYAINIIDPTGAAITLRDFQKHPEDFGTFVNNVNATPNLEFYIQGENIAKIEITTDTEYIHAQDWTETQDEKYWDTEYAQILDENQEFVGTDFDLLYDKQLTMTFEENFTDYDQIWFYWRAKDLYEWAAADDFSPFLGYGIKVKDLSEEERSNINFRDGKSALGHIQLDGYPEELLEDTIKIKITDHDGNVTEKSIIVDVSNNEYRQTVVRARMLN